MIKKIFLFLLSIVETVSWFILIYGLFHIDISLSGNLGSKLSYSIILLILIIIVNAIVKRLRDYKDNKWSVLLFLVSPIRLPLMLISIPINILLRIFVGADEVDFSGDSEDEDDALMNLTSILFMFSIDSLCISESKYKSKLINLLTLIFYFIPFTLLQFLLLKLMVDLIKDNSIADENIIVFFGRLILYFFAFLETSVLLVNGRCHETCDEYFDRDIRARFDFEDKRVKRPVEFENEDDLDWLEENTSDNSLLDSTLRENKLVRTKGGWTYVMSLPMFFTMIFSPINVFLVLIAIVISIISSNKKNVYCWYGTVDYSLCNNRGLQKILHFLLYFVVLANKKKYHLKKQKQKKYYINDGKVGFGWYFLGYLLSFTFIVGLMIACSLIRKGGNKNLKGKKLLIGFLFGIIINSILFLQIFKYIGQNIG